MIAFRILAVPSQDCMNGLTACTNQMITATQALFNASLRTQLSEDRLAAVMDPDLGLGVLG